ncbi:T9SS type A sorting domain-containing protein [Polaribacter dokdonensis]|uniref:Por secretion system C-terminal sorting domain-containing protein n=1 Tax=Polaribacter dokdonensis DSW-5 TaxID=1300348 RepID=A0A0N0UNQ0_9FLAO|nr:T9SS type A sorting domain-containing protein [Polaribacter dokdonensis]KOY52218.1 Por secretion system C-terminal sorting domain containing protein [Polaribacter dokdonensis DSW-5]SEE41298.1 Por secretion system C-terminal sorting domain-containing protein [Polaribacter dokdonensis DSW-5]
MKKKILLLFILSISISVFSQSTNSSAGGKATGNGSVTYTVGQNIYTTNIGTNGSVSQGVQQSLEIFVLSNKDFKELNLNAFTYPNPTKDKITLELSNLEQTNLSFTMFDIKGRTLLKGVIKEKNTSIIMKDYSAGVYLLKVHQQNKELKTFKIIKK